MMIEGALRRVPIFGQKTTILRTNKHNLSLIQFNVKENLPKMLITLFNTKSKMIMN